MILHQFYLPWMKLLQEDFCGFRRRMKTAIIPRSRREQP